MNERKTVKLLDAIKVSYVLPLTSNDGKVRSLADAQRAATVINKAIFDCDAGTIAACAGWWQNYVDQNALVSLLLPASYPHLEYDLATLEYAICTATGWEQEAAYIEVQTVKTTLDLS